MNRALLALLSLCAGLPLSAVSVVHGDSQKYHLQDVERAGDVVVSDETNDMKADFTLVLAGQRVMSSIADHSREQYTETTLAAQSELSSFRRAYTINRSVNTDPDGKTTTEVSSLQGKTVTVRVEKGKATLVSASGLLKPEDRKKLLGGATTRTPFFPDHDLAVGDEWSPDPAQIAETFKGADKVVAMAKFEEVVDWNGHSCARCRADLEVDGKPEGAPFAMHVKASGNVYYALDLQRTLQMELSGPLTIKGELQLAPGQNAAVEGTGTISMKSSNRWLKIEGKPVPAVPR